jgi:hypothetical protein
MADNKEIIAVASVASYHKMMHVKTARKYESMTKIFVLMCAQYDPNRLFDMLKDTPMYKKMDSSIFGITSVIGDYTNKKGITFKAHFTVNGKFIKKVGKDPNPIPYMGCFKVCKDFFKIDMDKLEEIVDLYNEADQKIEIDLTDLFILEDVDDLPLDYFGNNGRIAKGNY